MGAGRFIPLLSTDSAICALVMLWCFLTFEMSNPLFGLLFGSPDDDKKKKKKEKKEKGDKTDKTDKKSRKSSSTSPGSDDETAPASPQIGTCHDIAGTSKLFKIG